MATARRYDFAGLVQLAQAAGLTATEARTAAAIALAESSGVPTAVSATGDYGLWQINARSWPQFDRQRLLDPAYNARAMAVVKSTGRGWAHWTVFRTGAYQKHLPGASTPSAQGAQAAQGGWEIPGTGWEIPNPLDVAADAAGAATDVATGAAGAIAGDAVGRVLGGATKISLAIVLSAAGLALFVLGLNRLVSQRAASQAAAAAGVAATVASVVP